jgi:hypothetical protein
VRKPYEYYAKHLLLTAGVSHVAATLVSLGFGEQDYVYLHELREGLMQTRPMPFKPGTPGTDKWLRLHKVYSLRMGTSPAAEAKAMLQDFRFRPALEMLLLSGLSTDYIATRLEEASGEQVTNEAVMHYAHYFWNRQILTREEWKDFLISTNAEGHWHSQYPNGRDLFQAYLGDPQVALWKLGLMPVVNEEVVVDEIFKDSYMRLLEIRTDPNSVNTAKKAEVWASILFKCLEEKSKAGNVMRKALEELHKTSLRLRSLGVRDGRLLLDRNAEVIDLPDRGSREFPVE